MAASEKSPKPSKQKHSIFDDELGDDFLPSWKPGKMLSFDFDDNPAPKGKKKPFAALDMDFDFDNAFKIDMSGLDFPASPPKSQKTSSAKPQQNRSKADDEDMFGFKGMDAFNMNGTVLSKDKGQKKMDKEKQKIEADPILTVDDDICETQGDSTKERLTEGSSIRSGKTACTPKKDINHKSGSNEQSKRSSKVVKNLSPPGGSSTMEERTTNPCSGGSISPKKDFPEDFDETSHVGEVGHAPVPAKSKEMEECGDNLADDVLSKRDSKNKESKSPLKSEERIPEPNEDAVVSEYFRNNKKIKEVTCAVTKNSDHDRVKQSNLKDIEAENCSLQETLLDSENANKNNLCENHDIGEVKPFVGPTDESEKQSNEKLVTLKNEPDVTENMQQQEDSSPKESSTYLKQTDSKLQNSGIVRDGAITSKGPTTSSSNKSYGECNKLFKLKDLSTNLRSLVTNPESPLVMNRPIKDSILNSKRIQGQSSEGLKNISLASNASSLKRKPSQMAERPLEASSAKKISGVVLLSREKFAQHEREKSNQNFQFDAILAPKRGPQVSPQKTECSQSKSEQKTVPQKQKIKLTNRDLNGSSCDPKRDVEIGSPASIKVSEAQNSPRISHDMVTSDIKQKSEHCKEALEEMYTMLRKMYEAAMDLRVRALVTGNSFLMMNNPVDDDKTICSYVQEIFPENPQET